ncbi:MAG: alpha-glucosidase, partial [Clostridia bacterium]|nr:alpha-glucosidase [Clostridia bacterium]
IFVAPVIERGARARKVFLPQGDWIKFFDDKIYGGGKAYELDAPLGVPVAFYRKGGKYESIFSKISL